MHTHLTLSQILMCYVVLVGEYECMQATCRPAPHVHVLISGEIIALSHSRPDDGTMGINMLI